MPSDRLLEGGGNIPFTVPADLSISRLFNFRCAVYPMLLWLIELFFFFSLKNPQTSFNIYAVALRGAMPDHRSTFDMS